MERNQRHSLRTESPCQFENPNRCDMKERLLALTQGWSLNKKELITKVIVLIILGGVILGVRCGDLGFIRWPYDAEAYVTSAK
jgi:hypothetical protein